MPCATATKSNSSASSPAAESATARCLYYEEGGLALHLQQCIAQSAAVALGGLGFLGRNSAARYQDPHSVYLRNDDWSFRGNEFSGGDDIDELIAESSFSTGTQHRHRCPFCAKRNGQAGNEFSRRAEGWT